MTRVVEFSSDVWAKYKDAVHDTLSDALSKVPVWLWKKNMFFMGVDNQWWRQKTRYFPATQYTKGTHPLFVLREMGGMGVRVCPCSSKGGSARYIKKGCQLAQNKTIMDRDSFLMERFALSLPLSTMIAPLPEYMGLVPQSCIKEGRP